MRRLRGLLSLRPGEGRPVAFIVAVAGVVAAGLMIGQSSIEALFFARYGVDRLPVMYLALGVLMVVVTTAFGALLARAGRGRASLTIPVAFAVLAVGGRLAIAADVPGITQGLWLLQGAGHFVLGLAVWGVAGIVTDTRQAKRFFPLIGAGSVLGSVAGGLLTRPLAAWIGTPNLLLVWSATLLVAVVLAGRLLRAHPSPRRASGARSVSVATGLTAGFRTVRSSPLLRWLAVAAVLFSLLFFSLYLPFSRAATERYPDPSQLAGFFGTFFGLATALAFLLSLVVTNRLLARFGVPAVALVFPLLYVVAFGVLVIDRSFAVLAVARFAQVAWMQGGATSAWEAVVNTVPPDRRDQTRAFLYGGPTQVGTMLAGLIALIGERAFSPALLAGIGFGAAVLATVAMVMVRRWYPRELVRALREGRPSVFGAASAGAAAPLAPALADAAAVTVAIEGLRDPDVRVRRVAAAVLGDVGSERTAQPLGAALDDEDPEVRAAALRSIASLEGEPLPATVPALAADPDPNVRRTLADVLGSTDATGLDADGVLRRLLADPDARVRACAAVAFLRRSGSEDAAAAIVELSRSDDEEVRAEVYRAASEIGAALPPRLARAAIEDPSPAVRAQAAKAIGAGDGHAAVGLLVVATADPSRAVREAVGDAFAAIRDADVADECGRQLVVALERADRRDGALLALERLPVPIEADAIRRMASAAVERAVDRHRTGASIPRGRDARLDLLRDSLLHQADREARAALRAAALLGARSEVGVALESVADDDALRRANALEVIESLVERPLVRPLLAIWDESPAATDPTPTLARLAGDPDGWIRACAELAAAHGKGEPMETMTTLSPMERVLFLRKVSLFAELPPPDLLPVASVAIEATFGDGEPIAAQGDPGDEMHVIVDGDVDVVVHDRDGPHVIATRSAGDVVGEMALLTSEPRMAGLVARGAVRVLSIDRSRFASILRERPETALGVIRVLCHRLTEARPGAQGEGTALGDSTTAST